MNNETIPSDVNEKMAPATNGSQRTETDNNQGELSNNAGAGTSNIPLLDYAASTEFLRRFHPGRYWVLTSISLDKRNIVTNTFDANSEAECLAWLQEQGASRNVYFSVGEVPRKVQKKAERTDIANVWWLHVDIDPRAGEPLATEQPRILALLQASNKLPPPTVIVYSGGGYQAFWKLDNPIPINCDLATAEDAKRYNLQIEIVLGADNVHNIDRIMRLPGTINRPDDKKIAKGRIAVMAEVIEWSDERVYSIDQFVKAPEVGAAPASTLGKQKVAITGNVRRLNGPEELPAGIADRAKVVICQGFDPDEPRKFDGRSEWMYFGVCAMVRAACDDALIYSIITDPQFRISDSILDKGSMVDKYARRQIARAKEEFDDSAVSLINRRHFAALEGSRLVYYREEEDKSLTAMNSEAFKFATATIKVPKTTTNAAGQSFTREVPAATIWCEDPRRRYYHRGFVMDPKHAETDEEYNLWKGFGVDPAQGDWAAMREHIATVLAGGNDKYADYILKWAAWSFQNPATPPRTALVFRGGEGTGKGVFGRALVTAFGTHGQRVQTANQAFGKFNSHLKNCCLLFGDEISLVSKEQEGNLKGMITEPTLPIEGKGKDVVHAENHLHVILASNDEFVVPADEGARRFAMFDVAPTYKGVGSYWARLYGEIDNGGIAAMLYDLLALDLGKWHPEAFRPDTEALDEQKVQSLKPLPQYWLNCLQSGTIGFGTKEGDKVAIPSVAFVDMINQKLSLKDKNQITPSRLGHFFGKFGFEKVERDPRGWIIPSLTAARAAWGKEWKSNLKVKVAWGDEKEWQVSVPHFTGI